MMEEGKNGRMGKACSVARVHIDTGAKSQNLVILSVAKNLSTGCKLSFQTIVRPFASLMVTDQKMAKTASRLAATIRWQSRDAHNWNESFIVCESNAA